MSLGRWPRPRRVPGPPRAKAARIRRGWNDSSAGSCLIGGPELISHIGGRRIARAPARPKPLCRGLFKSLTCRQPCTFPKSQRVYTSAGATWTGKHVMRGLGFAAVMVALIPSHGLAQDYTNATNAAWCAGALGAYAQSSEVGVTYLDHARSRQFAFA